MNIIDLAILFIIALYTILGFKRGFTKEIVSFLGIFLVIVLSFILKNPLSTFLYERLPFFNFNGLFKGVTVLNILLYEVIALFITISILMIVLRVLMFVTGTFEKLLKFTIILGIPSKIMGAIVGFIEGIVWVFIFMYVVSLPLFNIPEVASSNLGNKVLENVPILSNMTSKFTKTINEFSNLKDEFEISKNSDEFNYKALDLFLEHKIITIDSVKKLKTDGKLNFKNIDKLINEYEGEKK